MASTLVAVKLCVNPPLVLAQFGKTLIELLRFALRHRCGPDRYGTYTNAVAIAARPSPAPVKPKPSEEVAATDTG